MDQAFHGIEMGRVHRGVHVKAQRTSASIERGDNTQPAPTFGHVEAFVHVDEYEVGFRVVEPHLEGIRPVAS